MTRFASVATITTEEGVLDAIGAGDDAAWAGVTSRYSGLIEAVLSEFRFDRSTRDDVIQATWLKLFEHAHTIRDERCLGGWLRTTARRLAIDVVRQRARVLLIDDYAAVEGPIFDDLDLGPSQREQQALCAGFRALSVESQELLSLVFADDPLPYADIARVLDRPVGSLGPTRARALDKLRSHYEAKLSTSAA